MWRASGARRVGSRGLAWLIGRVVGAFCNLMYSLMHNTQLRVHHSQRADSVVYGKAKPFDPTRRRAQLARHTNKIVLKKLMDYQ